MDGMRLSLTQKYVACFSQFLSFDWNVIKEQPPTYLIFQSDNYSMINDVKG